MDIQAHYKKHNIPDNFIDAWQDTIDVLARVFQVPAGLIMRVLPEEIEVLVSSKTQGNPYKPGEKVSLNSGLYCEKVMATKSPLYVADALKDPEWGNNPDIELNMNSYFGMPLLWPDGSVFGTVCVLDQNTVNYSEEYTQILSQFGKVIEKDFELFEQNKNLSATLMQLKEAHDELQKANDQMHRDLEAAREVQQALLPKKLPDTDNVKIEWSYHPCDELGGDMLNVFPVSENEIGLFVLDVSGHGVPAALLSISAARDLWPFAGHSDLDVDTRLAKVSGGLDWRLKKFNQTISMEATAGRFLTLLYGILDVTTLKFRFVSAGHPLPILVRDGKSSHIGSSCLPIGIINEADYEESAVTLKSGDRIYLYSDGFHEEVNANNELFGLDRLLNTVAQLHTLPVKDSIDAIFDAIYCWNGEKKLRDDASIVVIEIS